MPPPSRWSIISVTCRYALCGAALYWTNKQGIWSGFCQSQEAYDVTDKKVKQAIRKVEKYYGVRILRDEDTVKRELSYYSHAYWNKGIQNLFFFTANAGKIIQGYYSNYTLGNLMTKNKDEIESADIDDDLEEKGDQGTLPPEGKGAEGKYPPPKADEKYPPRADEKYPAKADERYIPETKRGGGGDQRSVEPKDVGTRPPDSKSSDDARIIEMKPADIKGGGVQPAQVAQAPTAGQTAVPAAGAVGSAPAAGTPPSKVSELKEGEKVIVHGREVDAKTAEKTDKLVDKIKKLHGM